jgi:hypothetical protein
VWTSIKANCTDSESRSNEHSPPYFSSGTRSRPIVRWIMMANGLLCGQIG